MNQLTVAAAAPKPKAQTLVSIKTTGGLSPGTTFWVTVGGNTFSVSILVAAAIAFFLYRWAKRR